MRMTSGMQEQSRRNWQYKGFDGSKYLLSMGCKTGFDKANLDVKSCRFSRVTSSDLYATRICSMSSVFIKPLHSGVKHQPSALPDQWLERSYVLYRPESIWAWTLALET